MLTENFSSTLTAYEIEPIQAYNKKKGRSILGNNYQQENLHADMM